MTNASGKIDSTLLAAADLLTLIKTVDGAGSGLDADLLDGTSSAGFAAASHAHAGEDITSGTVADARIASTITRDSEVMTIVLAADGASSTLDADLLDGVQGSGYALASHTHTTANITDYTTGTFSPGLRFGGGNTSMTFSTSPTGSYTKIGRLVFFTLQFTLSAKGSSTGSATIIDLPFTSISTYVNVLSIRMTAATLTGDAIPVATVATSTTTITLQTVDSGTLATMTDAHFGASTGIVISGCYQS